MNLIFLSWSYALTSVYLNRMKAMRFICLLLCVSFLAAQDSQPLIRTAQLASGLYKLTVGSVNLVALIGSDGILLSDCAFESSAGAIAAELNHICNHDVRFIINTHWHADHTGGNLHFGRNALIIAHKNVRKRLSEDKMLRFWGETHPAYPEHALPDIVFSDRLVLYINGEEVEIIHFPCGHTDGDAVVYFKKANVLHMGDLLFSDGFPALDFEMGGDLERFASNIDSIVAMMPENVRIVAGHGNDATIEDLKAYTIMLESTHQLILSALQEGMSLEEMKRKNILDDWKQYGETHFSCDAWINNVYFSLIQEKH